VKKLIVLLALAFTLVLVPAVSAQPMKPLRCGLVLELIFVDGVPDHWEGTVTLPGDIDGSITVTPSEASYNRPQTLEHFLETWVIETDDGSIWGFDEGIWSLKTLKWMANGRVTAATESWAYLAGCKVHVSGIVEFTAAGVEGEGTMTFVPGSHG